MKLGYLVVCTALLFLGCNSEKQKDEGKVNSKLIEERELQRIKDADYAWELGKKKYPSSTLALLPISGDTLVAGTQYYGLVLTTDAGKTWAEVLPEPIGKLTFDNKGQLWGMISFQGIHEPDLCILYLSHDLGKSWTKFELDTKDIFPKTFHSQPNQPLRIIDYEGNIFQLENAHPKLSWTLIDSVSQRNDTTSTPPKRTTIVADTYGREWAFNRQGIFLIGNDTIKVY